MEQQHDVGILIGRFQVHQLHDGHRYIIQHLLDRHSICVIMLGVPAIQYTKTNPLDFESRKLMIESEFPGLTVIPIYDTKHNDDWVRQVEYQLSSLYPNKSKVLYGSRDSFIEIYKTFGGKLSCEEIEPLEYYSGTLTRKDLKNTVLKSPDYRAGVITTTQNQFDSVYSVVDAIVYSKEYERILLGQKINDKNDWRLPGGFVDVSDNSLEDAVLREVREEAGFNLNLAQPVYLMSRLIDDWRYANPGCKLMSSVFAIQHLWGSPDPGDDLNLVKWVKMSELSSTPIVPEHREILKQIGYDPVKETIFIKKT